MSEQQENWADALVDDPDLSAENKIHWLKITCDDYWKRIERLHAALAPLSAVWLVALAALDDDAVLWEGHSVMGQPVRITVDDIRRPLCEMAVQCEGQSVVAASRLAGQPPPDAAARA